MSCPDDSTLEIRFWKKIDRNGPIPAHCPELGPCWIWTAYKDEHGRGRLIRAKDCAMPIKSLGNYITDLFLKVCACFIAATIWAVRIQYISGSEHKSKIWLRNWRETGILLVTVIGGDAEHGHRTNRSQSQLLKNASGLWSIRMDQCHNTVQRLGIAGFGPDPQINQATDYLESAAPEIRWLRIKSIGPLLRDSCFRTV